MEKKEKQIDFQKAVQKIRAHLKLSQPAFAKMIAVNVETVRRWEQGRKESRMGLMIIEKLYKHYGKRIPKKG